MLFAIPRGLTTLLSLAAAHEPFAEALQQQREKVAPSAGVSLKASERHILASVSGRRLKAMIDEIRRNQPTLVRRRFLKSASSALLLLATGSAASSCTEEQTDLIIEKEPESCKGTRINRPLRDDQIIYTSPRSAELEGALTGQRVRLYLELYPEHGRDPKGIKAALAAVGADLCAAILTSQPELPVGGGYVQVTLAVERNGSVSHVSLYSAQIQGPTALKGLERTFSNVRFSQSNKRNDIMFNLIYRATQ